VDAAGKPGVVHHLRDGTPVRLRLIGPADRARLAAGFEKLSRESRYWRFFTAMPHLPERMLDRLVATDGWKHVAIGAEVASDDPAAAEGLGVARFIRLDDAPEVAEVAVAVVDAKQGLGLGTLLLRTLVDAARERGIRRFRAMVLSENARARALLEEHTGEVSVRRENGCLVYEVILPERTEEEFRGKLLDRLLKLAASGVQFVFRVIGRDEIARDETTGEPPKA
jgi:RimJ/RimL family protein N-acetyltransferase